MGIDEVERLEDKLRAEMAADRAQGTASRHALAASVQQVLIQLAEMGGRSTADKWIMRALIAVASIETTFIVSNLHRLMGG